MHRIWHVNVNSYSSKITLDLEMASLFVENYAVILLKENSHEISKF